MNPSSACYTTLSITLPIALFTISLGFFCHLPFFSFAQSQDRVPRTTEIIARFQTPSGELEVSYEELLAWRQLQNKIFRARGEKNPPSQSLEYELKSLAMALHLARSQPLNEFSADTQKEIIRSQNRALAWAYLSEIHEKKLTLETIPQQYIELAIKSNLGLFRHPPLKRGVHFLIHTNYELSVSTKPPVFTHEDYQRTREAAEHIYQLISKQPPRVGQDLEHRLQDYQKLLPLGYTLRFENLGTFPQRGRFVEPFSDACFALKEEEHLTHPIQTQFGLHIAWIDEHIPAKHTPQEELDAEIRRRILDEVRGLELNALLNEDRTSIVWVDEDYFLGPTSPISEAP